MSKKLALILVLWGFLVGCAVNPVTGQRELTLVSDQQAIAVGSQQYAPAQQMQGGVYTQDPQLTAYVNRVGQKLGVASGVQLPYEFVVLNSSVPNAWALPGGKIAINRGLLVQLRNEAELAAVLGHEIAHAAARHGAKRMERSLVTQGVLMGTALATARQGYGNYVVGAVAQAGQLIGLKYSRDAEREADFYGTEFMAKAGYDPRGAVTLQEKFLELSRASGAQNMGWLASHPTSQERVNNNRQHSRQLVQQGYEQGRLGGPDFAAATQQLRQTKPAYDAFDEAAGLVGQEDLDAALVAVNRALGEYDREALFHGLRGAIRYQQGRYADALTNFDRAVNLDTGYFAHYLHRGLTHAALEDPARARSDLDRSVQLLPTSTAYQRLGQIAESTGDTEGAKRYYEQAAKAGGEAGQAARARYVAIDIKDRPGEYVLARVVVESPGQNWLVVENRSGMPLADVTIRVELQSAEGRDTTTITLEELSERATQPVASGVVLTGGTAYTVTARPNS